MIIEPKLRGFICTTAHPGGCKVNVEKQIACAKAKGPVAGPKKVLVIGASTGYGLASRIAAAYCYGADTLGIMFEKPSTDKRTATPGWYNTAAFEAQAAKDGCYAKSINGDAYSPEIKEQAIEQIRQDFGQVDLVIYSLASPRRVMPDGSVYNSVLKTTDVDFTNKSLDLRTNEITTATITPADEAEIAATIKVMGGEDWIDWIDALAAGGVLADHATTIAYSYIGPTLTYPVYFNGTIGKAKEHLYQSVHTIEEKHPNIKAIVSINKAIVTQSSSAIPIVPLYMAILYKVMKENGTHENCMEQMNRLYRDHLSWEPQADSASVILSGVSGADSEGRIRLDDLEMREEIQQKVMDSWNQVNTGNVDDFVDLAGYWEDFHHMFGFGFSEIDYGADVPEF